MGRMPMLRTGGRPVETHGRDAHVTERLAASLQTSRGSGSRLRAPGSQAIVCVRRERMDRREFVKRAAVAVVASVAALRTSLAGEQGARGGSTKSAIPKRPLGKTGVEVPVLILGGVVAMKYPPTPSFHPAELAEAALDAGITYFDTAPGYGDGQSERNYGEVLATRRREVFLAT
ncbi:MAG: hypothetical protein FJ280_31400, partial [Planctomycetes bacterium]|nr:hypothetical protein [Planctomycetota bacterium]